MGPFPGAAEIEQMKARGEDPVAIYAAEERLALGREAERIKAEVFRAFDGVTLGAGIGLFEAQGIDDYRTEAACAELRAGDEKSDWRAIAADDLKGCYSSLSFFDAEGMRFHLPAYLVLDLEGRFNQELTFTLAMSMLVEEQMALLNGEQRAVVRRYLELALRDDTHAFEHDHIRRALAGYWAR